MERIEILKKKKQCNRKNKEHNPLVNLWNKEQKFERQVSTVHFHLNTET